MNTEQLSTSRTVRRTGIFAVLAFVWIVITLAPSAFAQTGLSVMGPAANGNVTATDPTTGDRFSFNINNVTVGPNGMPISETLSNGMTVTVNSAPTTIPITVTLPSGASRTDPLSIQFQPSNLVLVTGNLLTGAVNCTINTATGQIVSGNCGAAGPLLGIISPGISPMAISPAQAAAMAAAPSAKAAAAAAVRSQTLQVTNMVSDRIRAISRDLASGLGQPSGQPGASTYRGISAGSPDTRWGVWGDASGSFIGNNSSVGYDGTSVVALSGIDYIVDPNWLVGFNAGYTNGQLGLKSFTGSRTSNGALVGPYASYIISPNFSVDGLFNYTRLSNDISTVAPGPTGGFGSNRYTGAANLNVYTDSDGIKLTLFTGYAYTFEGSQPSVLSNVPPFTNSIRFGVFKLGGEAGYPIGDFEPYLPLTFEYQTTKPQDQTSRAALQVGVGVRYQWTDQMKGGLLFTATEFQENWRDLKIEGNLRWTF